MVTHGDPVDWVWRRMRRRRAAAKTILVRKVCLNAVNRRARMNTARKIEPDLRLKVAQLHVEMGDWVPRRWRPGK